MTSEPFDLADLALRDRAVRAARGAEPFDVLLGGATLVDVATSELRAADVGLVGPLIASVHPRGERTDAAERLDLKGRFIAPGLIDAHLHIESSMLTPRRYAETVVPQGTTSIVWDPHEFGNVLGLDGVRYAVAATRDLPLRVFVLAPSSVPSAPGLEVTGADFGPEEMSQMLGMPDIAGVAEVMTMRELLERQPRAAGIVNAGLQSGKLVCGHARDLEGRDLIGFAAAGIESDHEITSGEDLVAKLRAGFTIELRGSHDYVLPGAVEAINRLPHMPQTLTLCTDDVFPDDLVEHGGISHLLRRLVAYGMKPVDGLRAATLNAAMRLKRNDLGLVAPGKRADIVVFNDLSSFVAERVFVSGRLAAVEGRLTLPLAAEPPRPSTPIKVPRLTPQDFTIRAPGNNDRAQLRTIVTPRFTRWGQIEVPVKDGSADLPDDVLVMAAIHRHGRSEPVPRLAPLEDWGRWRGALATTVSHDSHNLVVFGRDPVDMAAAANALIDAGGGMAVAAGGTLKEILRLPFAGLVSDDKAPVIADRFRRLRKAADEIADWKPPVRTFKAVVGASLACNPGPHLTDRGLTDGTTGEVFASALVTGAAGR